MAVTQAELAFEVRVPSAGTQNYVLLMALERGERLTVVVALKKYGVYALSQRIGELKRMGWPIQTRLVKTWSGKLVSEYWFER